MARRLALLLLLIVLAAPALARAEPVETAYSRAADTFHALRRAEGTPPARWRRVAETFLRIYSRHPAHRRGPDSLFSAALALRAAREAGGAEEVREEALARFRQFVNRYPAHRLADDSLMHVATLHAQVPQETQRAYLAYRQVQLTYPEGDQAALARREAAALEARGRRNGPPPAAAANGERGAAAATVKRLLFSSLADFTRVILTTDAIVSYDYNRLPAGKGKPARVYLDLKHTRPHEDLAPEHKVGDGVLERIRIGPNGPDTTRVVFDLKEVENFEVKNLHLPYEKKIIVDLYPVGAAAGFARAGRPAEAEPPPATPTLRNMLGLKVRNVAW